MKKIIEKLKKFFFPPEGTPRWLRILPYAILGLLTIVVLVGGNAAWEYTNSPVFCGTSCHTMPPEYSAYLVSPHARVKCVECHLGRDVFTTTFTRKAGDLRHVILNITKNYEYPIRAQNMRPARESCETCHFPEKFSDDSLRHIQNYLADMDNTPQDIFLIMKTGGGTAREGLGRGIHWHIENQVLFYATDELQQDIPYVRVVSLEGETMEYFDISSGLGPEEIAGKELVQMDCITCHNRITHEVPSPEEAISQAIKKGLMVPDLPYLVRESIRLLRGDYPDKASAIEAMNELGDFYKEEYPDIFESRNAEIQAAILILQDIYDQSIFPEQESDWDTHPDNMGHKNDPGCFRCHDGKHLTADEEAIRLECNICHSIPVVGDPAKLTTNIELVSGPEPFSHTLTNWMTLHGKVKDGTCSACHVTPKGYETLVGKPPADDTFCGNEACHGSDWTYTGFRSPELEPILEEQLLELLESSSPEPEDGSVTYLGSIGSLFDTRCATCHTGDKAPAGLDLSSYEGILTGGASGPGIVPNDPEASVIYQFQLDPPDTHIMQLTDAELETLLEWILAGAPEE